MFDVIKLSDTTVGGVSKASFRTCDAVCSVQIDVEIEDDVVRCVQYTGGCHGNTQGVAALCQGMPRALIMLE